MGRRPFVNKSSSTKYDLLYSSQQDPSTAPEREWVESSRHVGIGKPDAARLASDVHKSSLNGGRYPEGHPLAWLNEEAQPSISEERRQEIIRLGFPDDGYDYLQHMRQGHSTSELPVSQEEDDAEPSKQEEGHGPSHFVPAPDFQVPLEDYKAIDASRLTIHQAAADEEEASLLAGGATGFSRELQTLRGRNQREVEDLQALMKQFEMMNEIEGDLLEDFILSATEAATQGSDLENSKGVDVLQPSSNDQAASSDQEEVTNNVEESDDEYSSLEEGTEQPAPSENKSFASTYWRPERHDRKGDLSIIDERFEQLALEYDSDDIGELDQLEGHPSLKGTATTDRFSKIMDQFLAVHNTQDHNHDSGHAYKSAAQTSSNPGELALEGPAPSGSTPQGPAAASKQLSSSAATEAEKAAAAASLARAKEHLQLLEREEEGVSGREDKDEEAAIFDDRPRDNWDCESILTSCSTAYNHPKTLDAGPPRRQPRRQGQIKLSNKTGLPLLPGTEQSERGANSPSQNEGHGSISVPTARRPDESSDEKKQRKGAIKEAKRQARANKKELKLMFKDAAQKQQRQTVPSISVTGLA